MLIISDAEIINKNRNAFPLRKTLTFLNNGNFFKLLFSNSACLKFCFLEQKLKIQKFFSKSISHAWFHK